MSYGVGDKVEVTTAMYLGRWVYPGEKGEVVGRHSSPAGQEVYGVIFEDGKEYTLASGEIREVKT